MKCPLYTRRVGAYDWFGIKCTSEKWSNGFIIGKYPQWNKFKRESHIKEFCNGCFENCYQYKNHTN